MIWVGIPVDKSRVSFSLLLSKTGGQIVVASKLHSFSALLLTLSVHLSESSVQKRNQFSEFVFSSLAASFPQIFLLLFLRNDFSVPSPPIRMKELKHPLRS